MTWATSWLVMLPWALDPKPAEEDLRPGWIAFSVILLLGAACLLLWFSMRRQIRRIQVPREEQAPPASQDTEHTSRP